MGCLIRLIVLFLLLMILGKMCENSIKENDENLLKYRYTIEIHDGIFTQKYFSNYCEEKDGVLYFDVDGRKQKHKGEYTVKENY